MKSVIIKESGGMSAPQCLADPETIIQLINWLEQDRDYACVVALYFQSDILAGYIIEQAGIGDSMLLESQNLFRAALRYHADSVTIVYCPLKNCTPDELQALRLRDQELTQAGRIHHIEVRDLVYIRRGRAAGNVYLSVRNILFDTEKY